MTFWSFYKWSLQRTPQRTIKKRETMEMMITTLTWTLKMRLLLQKKKTKKRIKLISIWVSNQWTASRSNQQQVHSQILLKTKSKQWFNQMSNNSNHLWTSPSTRCSLRWANSPSWSLNNHKWNKLTVQVIRKKMPLVITKCLLIMAIQVVIKRTIPYLHQHCHPWVTLPLYFNITQ